VIRAILIDLGKVIVPFDFAIGYKAMQALCGTAPDILRERIRETGLVPQFEQGLIDSGDFVKRLCTHLRLEIGFVEFCDIWNSIFARETLLPEAFIVALHENYRLILVSNTNAIHFGMIRDNFPIMRHFDRWVLSYEVNAMKPAPQIYESAIEAARCRPEECFFTDDLAENVDAAQSLGIDAVQFHDYAQLRSELQARGVVWVDREVPAMRPIAR
jgi:putative hydrolase of the HAD superfamily